MSVNALLENDALRESHGTTASIELISSSTEGCFNVDAAELAIANMTANLGSSEILPAAFPGVPFVPERTLPRIQWSIDPKMRLAKALFKKMKREWQRDHGGQWVALYGDELLGFASSDLEADEKYNPDGSLTAGLFLGFIEIDPSACA